MGRLPRCRSKHPAGCQEWVTAILLQGSSARGGGQSPLPPVGRWQVQPDGPRSSTPWTGAPHPGSPPLRAESGPGHSNPAPGPADQSALVLGSSGPLERCTSPGLLPQVLEVSAPASRDRLRPGKPWVRPQGLCPHLPGQGLSLSSERGETRPCRPSLCRQHRPAGPSCQCQGWGLLPVPLSPAHLSATA